MERTARDFKGIWIDREIWLSEERIKDKGPVPLCLAKGQGPCRVPTLLVMAFLRMPRGKDEPKTLGELGVLGATLFRFGEQTRAKSAKDAKDAKVKGKVVKEPVPNGAK